MRASPALKIKAMSQLLFKVYNEINKIENTVMSERMKFNSQTKTHIVMAVKNVVLALIRTGNLNKEPDAVNVTIVEYPPYDYMYDGRNSFGLYIDSYPIEEFLVKNLEVTENDIRTLNTHHEVTRTKYEPFEPQIHIPLTKPKTITEELRNEVREFKLR